MGNWCVCGEDIKKRQDPLEFKIDLAKPDEFTPMKKQQHKVPGFDDSVMSTA